MKCPNCGAEGSLSISYLYEYSKDFRIKKNGQVSKVFTYKDDGPLFAGYVFCSKCCRSWSLTDPEDNVWVDEQEFIHFGD